MSFTFLNVFNQHLENRLVDPVYYLSLHIVDTCPVTYAFGYTDYLVLRVWIYLFYIESKHDLQCMLYNIGNILIYVCYSSSMCKQLSQVANVLVRNLIFVWALSEICIYIAFFNVILFIHISVQWNVGKCQKTCWNLDLVLLIYPLVCIGLFWHNLILNMLILAVPYHFKFLYCPLSVDILIIYLFINLFPGI